jgi:hypothetical protein
MALSTNSGAMPSLDGNLPSPSVISGLWVNHRVNFAYETPRACQSPCNLRRRKPSTLSFRSGEDLSQPKGILL